MSLVQAVILNEHDQVALVWYNSAIGLLELIVLPYVTGGPTNISKE